jgi:hypothetical protein
VRDHRRMISGRTVPARAFSKLITEGSPGPAFTAQLPDSRGRRSQLWRSNAPAPAARLCTSQAADKIANTPQNTGMHLPHSCYLYCMISPIRGNRTEMGVQVSDTLKPHERPFAGMLDRHPNSASGRGECSLLASLGGPPFPAVARVSASGIRTDDDRRRLVIPGAERPVVRVIGEDNAVGAQLVYQHRRTGRAGHLSNAAAPRSRFPGRPGE